MKKIATMLLDFIFIVFFARRAAAKLRAQLPMLGMTSDQALVIACPCKNSGQLYLRGFGIPRLEFDLFLRGKKGWEGQKLAVCVTPKNRLQLETKPGETEPLSFFDPRAKPVVQFLKSIWVVWPYTLYMTASHTQIAARAPSWKG